MISSPFIIRQTRRLFLATPCQTADISLTSEISQQFNTSSCTNFYLNSSLVFMKNIVSSHFYTGPSATFIASCSTLIRRYLISGPTLARTRLSNSTFIYDGNPYTDISSHFAPSLLPVLFEYTIPARTPPAYVYYLSTISVIYLPHFDTIECTGYVSSPVLLSLVAVL